MTLTETHRQRIGSDGEFRRVVVVGVDGSDSSSTALAWAAEEARLRGATLRIVEAWHLPVVTYGTYVTPIESAGEWAADTQRLLDEQAAKVLGVEPEVTVVTEVVEGMAAPALIEASKGAELVVVGSRGRGGFTGLLLGSVSAQVAHHATCPVVIVRS